MFETKGQIVLINRESRVSHVYRMTKKSIRMRVFKHINTSHLKKYISVKPIEKKCFWCYASGEGSEHILWNIKYKIDCKIRAETPK